MIAEFQRHWEEQYKIKTSEQLQSVIDKRNTLNEKNAQYVTSSLVLTFIHTCMKVDL